MNEQVKERPILFSGEMVRSILDGRKTQTRRVAKVFPWQQHGYWHLSHKSGITGVYHSETAALHALRDHFCPFGRPGDRLWVRETFQPLLDEKLGGSPDRSEYDYKTGRGYACGYPATDGVQEYYDASEDEAFVARCTPSIHMPRWASRITLEITDVRVQRLQDISNADAMAEGIGQTWGDFLGHPPQWALDSISSKHGAPGSHLYDNRTSAKNFALLWNSLHGENAWDANPWVWALTFRRLPQDVAAGKAA